MSKREAAPKDAQDKDKAALRRRLLQLRRATPPETRQAWDQQIAAQLLGWCRLHQPRSMGVYWPIQAEPDLHALYPILSAAGIQLALPVVHTRHAPLTFVRWAPGDMMEKDVHGIPVPASREAAIWPEVVLIPCLGFNRDKFRLGYGGGYYDRTLAAAPKTGPLVAIGVAYQCGLADFHSEPHDVALNVLITEQADLA